MRGAWIEIFLLFASRRLKPSLPVRGAWIEIFLSVLQVGIPTSLPVRGAWIEITVSKKKFVLKISRSPCGERGLK